MMQHHQIEEKKKSLMCECIACIYLYLCFIIVELSCQHD
jgi:hypothetical protein